MNTGPCAPLRRVSPSRPRSGKLSRILDLVGLVPFGITTLARLPGPRSCAVPGEGQGALDRTPRRRGMRRHALQLDRGQLRDRGPPRLRLGTPGRSARPPTSRRLGSDSSILGGDSSDGIGDSSPPRGSNDAEPPAIRRSPPCRFSPLRAVASVSAIGLQDPPGATRASGSRRPASAKRSPVPPRSAVPSRSGRAICTVTSWGSSPALSGRARTGGRAAARREPSAPLRSRRGRDPGPARDPPARDGRTALRGWRTDPRVCPGWAGRRRPLGRRRVRFRGVRGRHLRLSRRHQRRVPQRRRL